MSTSTSDSAPAAPAAPPTVQDGDHPITQAIQATPQELGHKVFVGNLPFSVNDDNIKDIFAKVGPVTDAQIIHRGTRSLGYGFVTYTNEADAAAAVSQLDKTEISGRQVNVEVAKPMPAPGALAARAAQKATQLKATRETAQEAQQDQDVDGEASVGKPKKARKPRKPRGPRQPRADDETEEAGDAPAPADGTVTDASAAPKADGTAPATRKPRNRKRKGAAAAAIGGALADGAEGAPPALGEAKGTNTATGSSAAPAAARQPRRRGPPTGAPSSTLLFVGNLNFSVTNDTLAAAFAPTCAVRSAVVVVRKFGQSAGRSKGFAFVEFKTPEDQQRALEQFQGRELEGRPMSLKVAIQPVEGGGEGQKEGEGAAAQAAAKADEEKVDEQNGRTEGDAIIVAS